jgi:hypothetical protein
MSAINDPYRLDAGKGHRHAAWFKEHLEIAGVTGRIHLRGLHYRLVSVSGIKLPNGMPYVNNAKCYAALNQVSKPARWLGYVDFERIVDNRNEPPFMRVPEDTKPRDGRAGFVSTDDAPIIPRASLMLPRVGLVDDNFVQPYRIVLIGEKSSLREELEPLAEEIRGELILPSGELSATLLYDFVRRAAKDGRPAVVIYFSDFDPSGYNMPISVARKIQALVDFKFPGLLIELYHAALNIEQVRRLDLPSTPLKPEEKRADKWRETWGCEQVEIDALAALHPGELISIAREAVSPFFDFDAADRRDTAERAWTQAANAALRANPAYAEALADLEEVTERMREDASEIRRVRDSVCEIPTGDLPPFYMPVAKPEGERPEPMFCSWEPWLDQTQRLKEKRNLGGDDGDGDDDEVS